MVRVMGPGADLSRVDGAWEGLGLILPEAQNHPRRPVSPKVVGPGLQGLDLQR